jgi:hypothetical protein
MRPKCPGALDSLCSPFSSNDADSHSSRVQVGTAPHPPTASASGQSSRPACTGTGRPSYSVSRRWGAFRIRRWPVVAACGQGCNVGAGQMATLSPVRGRVAVLTGRRTESDALDRLVEAVRAGESRALVVRGEPGVGKTALLEYIVEHASGCRVLRAAGVQSEMELAFAGLHQLLGPMLDRLERLPVPQCDALRTVFGVGPGSAPDRFLVGLAVLSLLADAAEGQPLICLVDDEQWLDRASAQVLAFVARRLDAESVGLVFAARGTGDELAGLPELVVEGLARLMRVRCWTRCSPGPWTSASGTRSSARRAVTPWRCWSCRGA